MGNREILNELLENLKPQVDSLLDNHLDFEEIWRSTIEKYNLWFNQYQEDITGLGRNLALLEQLSHAFNYDLRGDTKISDLILVEAPLPGQNYLKDGVSGTQEIYRVIDRQITPGFGLLLFLESEEGEEITEEIFE